MSILRHYSSPNSPHTSAELDHVPNALVQLAITSPTACPALEKSKAAAITANSTDAIPQYLLTLWPLTFLLCQ